jgi:hypothetical protein
MAEKSGNGDKQARSFSNLRNAMPLRILVIIVGKAGENCENV